MHSNENRILVIDDEKDVSEGLIDFLSEAGYIVDAVHGLREIGKRLERGHYHAAILDLKVPGKAAMSLLKEVKARSPDTGVIVITAQGEVATAVEAMRLGAYDFLPKPTDFKRIRLSLERLLEHQALVVENKELRARLDSATSFEEIVHRSEVMRSVCDTIRQAAMTDVPVLITGETGTGKELVARAIWQTSSRADDPMVPVNCGAIPESLFESELFGHVRGAFTGAHADKPGRFAAAEGGTLFFDEVSEIPIQNQVDLLRVLEEKVYTPVGGMKPHKANVRTIFATNRDLDTLMRQGGFREDLYYRINVVPIQLPLLKDRKEDIPLIVDTFLAQLCSLHGKPRKRFTAGAMQSILNYDWPGNVRELKNVIEQIVVTCEDQEVGVKRLPVRVRESGTRPERFEMEIGKSIQDVERALIEHTLTQVTSNRKEAAAILGISVRALQYKLKRYQVRPPQ